MVFADIVLSVLNCIVSTTYVKGFFEEMLLLSQRLSHPRYNG